MAEIKKYLDKTALGTLVDQIKSEDAKILAAAKKYTDEAPFDTAGSAATAKSEAIAEAKAKVQALADGQVKLNKEAIATLNGADTVEGSVAKAVKDAKDALQANIDTVDEKADDNAEAIAAINNAETGILKQAKDYADAEDAKIEQSVANLVEYVGTLPEDTTAKDVVDYVNIKTAGIATDAALEELQNQLNGAQGEITAIKGDYLKAADKTELEGKITKAQTAADNAQEHSEGVASDLAEEISRATEIEAGLRTDVDAVKADYLKKADKDGLAKDIKEVSDAVAVLNGDESTEGSVAKEIKDAINAFATQITDNGTYDTFKELVDYVAEHGGEAADMAAAIDVLEGLVGEKSVATQIAEAITKENLDQYATDEELAAAIARIVVLEGAKHTHDNKEVLDGITAEKVAKWDASQANAEATAQAYTDAEVAKDRERLQAVEAMLGDGDNSVAELIATAKQEAIDAAAQDAADKDVVVLSEAQKYADAEDAKIETALAELTETVGTKAAQADLTALGNRVTPLETKVGTLETEMDAVQTLADTADKAAKANAEAMKSLAKQSDLESAVTRITVNEGAIKTINETLVDKADSDDLNAAVTRIAKNETDIAANTSAINSFSAITPDEVNALFA